MPIIAPSLLAADFLHLGAACNMLNESEAQWFHLDVMDGSFVPNISYGLPIIEQIKKTTSKVLDVHLMIVHPEKYIADFKKAGADILTVHYEACVHLHRTIQSIKEAGMKAGVALNPHTSVSLLEDVIEDLDLVLIMSVNPGYGGQKFIKNAVSKVSQVKEMIARKGSNALIEVDGGVNGETAVDLLKAGADVLVAGSYVFNSVSPAETILSLKSL